MPKNYIIVEIIPSHSKAINGFLVQLQALKIKDSKIISRMDYRLEEKYIENEDLLKMTSYDKELFTYVSDKNKIMEDFIKFIGKLPLLIIDNYYTIDYLESIKNKKESVFKYLHMEYNNDVFDKIINKYKLEPSNHLVDLLYEALIFENDDNNIDNHAKK